MALEGWWVIRADAWVRLMMRLVLRRNFDISVIFKCNQKHGDFIITGQPQHSQRRTSMSRENKRAGLSGLGSREYVALDLDRVRVRANAIHTDTKKDKGKDESPITASSPSDGQCNDPKGFAWLGGSVGAVQASKHGERGMGVVCVGCGSLACTETAWPPLFRDVRCSCRRRSAYASSSRVLLLAPRRREYRPGH